MAQHDNGRRAGGHQGEPWQQGNQNYAGPSQQDQASGTHYGSQQGGYRDPAGGRGHQEQYDVGGHQQGDPSHAGRGAWGRGADDGGRDRDRDRAWTPPRGDYGGQGSFGGQASTADYDRGDRGDRDRGDRHDTRPGPRGQGYDEYANRGASYGGRDFGQGDDQRGGPDWQRQGAEQEWQSNSGWQGGGQAWQSGRGAGTNHSYHDPDYHQWRGEQLRKLDADYDEWRQHRYQRFASEFDDWRRNRANSQGNQASSGADNAGGSSNLSAGVDQAAGGRGGHGAKSESSGGGESHPASTSTGKSHSK